MEVDTLEITTKIGCSNKCVYCPQDKLIDAYSGNKIMTLEQCKTILNNTPKDIQIAFVGFCEPFLNPSASMMMRYAIENFKIVFLYTTMTGFCLKDIRILKGLTFQHVAFHEYEGCDKDFFEDKARLFRENINAEVFEQFTLKPEIRNNRAGNLSDMPVKKGKFSCLWSGKTFRRNVVLPNGDVYLCCSDYSLKHKLGNMFTTHFNNLDRQSIIDLSNQEDSEIICRKCEMIIQ